MWPLRRVFVKDAFADPNHWLAEGPAADALPRRQAIAASDHGIEQQRRVFHEPGHHRVVNGDLLVDPLFKA